MRPSEYMLDELNAALDAATDVLTPSRLTLNRDRLSGKPIPALSLKLDGFWASLQFVGLAESLSLTLEIGSRDVNAKPALRKLLIDGELQLGLWGLPPEDFAERCGGFFVATVTGKPPAFTYPQIEVGNYRLAEVVAIKRHLYVVPQAA